MLPLLTETDLLSIKPDLILPDIWKKNLDLSKIPREFGCYAFYNKEEIVYIGSACSFSYNSSGKGLYAKVLFYRSYEKGHYKNPKILIENAINPLTMKLWVTTNPGDALKYEVEAIKKYKPRLNKIFKGILKEDYDELKRKASNKLANKYISQNNYDPDKIIKCIKCKKKKKSSKFHKNKRNKFGIQSVCSKCVNKFSREKYLKRPFYNPDLTRVCRKCKKTKKHSEFPKRPSNKEGVTSICKSCTENIDIK